jgi:cephalosporin-C deacetylase
MPYVDLPLDELRRYQPPLDPPEHLGAFWASTLEDARRHDIGATFVPVDAGLRLIETQDVTFRGFGGHPIKAWLRLPVGIDGPLPTVVQYLGYGGGRGRPHHDLLWAAAGYAHLLMDTRGQGSSWMIGDTADPGSSGEPHLDGFMTDGILSPETYYYRRVVTDAVRAVEAVRRHPAVDPARVVVMGGSQGGGLSLAVAGLVPDLAGVMAEVPFLCDFPRAIRIADSQPYVQIAGYLKTHRDRVEQVERTLAYFDGAILGRTAVAPALFAVALMDTICPPSTVYAAYNWYAGPKEMREYAFNDHEGGGDAHEVVQLDWLRAAARAGRAS